MCPYMASYSAPAQQQQPLLIRVPSDVPFSKSILDCVNFKSGPSDCPGDRLVDIKRPIDDAMAIVNKLTMQIGSVSTRIPPLVFTRLARGGKTTLLKLLFDRLKNDVKARYAPIIINFNGNFGRRAEESYLDALMRLIATQLVDVPAKDAGNIVCDETALLKHIDETSKGMRVVLLIDELNSLCSPVDLATSVFLKDHFLDAANRYLVYSTHVPMEVDSHSSSMEPRQGSRRGYKTVHLPKSYELKDLRKMSEECSSLNECEAALYGGIPSLIYSSMSPDAESPKDRFTREMRNMKFDKDLPLSLLKEFVRSILTGNPISDDRFDRFSDFSKDKKHVWPLCYIACMANQFTTVPEVASPCVALVKLIDINLAAHTEQIRTGKAWEVIVKVAVILRCLDAQLNQRSNPFGVIPLSRPAFQTIVVQMDEQVETLDAAREFIKARLVKRTSPTLFVFTPRYPTFPDLDGFVSFVDPSSSSPTTTVAYQCKQGNATAPVPVPAWINLAYLLRGKAPKTTRGAQDELNWEYPDAVWMMLNLLGYSLSPVYPREWEKE